MAANAIENGFGPVCEKRDQEKKRIIEAQITIIVVSVFLFIVYRLGLSSQAEVFSIQDFYFATGAAAAIIVSEGVRRLCLFAEEYNHIDQRYKKSKWDALEACISLPRGKVVVLTVLVGSVAYTIHAWSFSFLLYLIISISFSFIGNLLGIEGTTQVEISHKNEMTPKNVSAGTAWSYYFGYLKILLPAFPTIFEKARGEKFRIDGDDIRDKVTDMSLFIVIPKDGYCYKAFNLVDDRIQFQHTMPELKRTRGGVAERIYKNSLYKISIEGKDPKYAVVEYATPLLCFYDMAEHAKIKFTPGEKEKEIVQFYLKLKNIIDNDPECAGKCKFILTGPVASNDEGNNRMADMIYEEIED